MHYFVQIHNAVHSATASHLCLLHDINTHSHTHSLDENDTSSASGGGHRKRTRAPLGEHERCSVSQTVILTRRGIKEENNQDNHKFTLVE